MCADVRNKEFISCFHLKSMRRSGTLTHRHSAHGWIISGRINGKLATVLVFGRGTGKLVWEEKFHCTKSVWKKASHC